MTRRKIEAGTILNHYPTFGTRLFRCVARRRISERRKAQLRCGLIGALLTALAFGLLVLAFGGCR